MWMGWHFKWVDVSTSLVVWHWPLTCVDCQILYIYIYIYKMVVENSTLPWHYTTSSQLLDYFGGTLFEWMKKDIDGWNITCIFNCTSTLIIITYTIPTYYLPICLIIIIFTLCTCDLLTIVTYTYILHTYLPRYLHTID
jgi:hypothetical protein